MANGYVDYWADLAYRRANTLIIVAGVVMGLVVLVTLLWPPVYKSHAEILVKDDRAQLLVSPGLQTNSPENPAIVANPVNQQDLNSEVQLLTSLYLVKQAIAGERQPAKFSPTNILTDVFGAVLQIPAAGYRYLHGLTPLGEQDDWAIKLASHLNAYVINQSNVIEVDFESHNARWSRTFLDRLVAKYLAYHARISHDPEAAAFFQNQSKALETQLNAAEGKLGAYESKTGITDLVDQRQALVNRLSSLQLEYSKTVSQLSAANRQVSELQVELRSTPSRIENKVSSVQNLALQQIKPQVLKLKAQRAELLTRYLPTSMRIQEIDAEITAAQSILNRESHLVVKERSTDLNPVWVSLDTNLQQAEGNVSSLKGGRDELATQIADTKKELGALVQYGLNINRLKRDVTAKKESYLSYLRKAEEARAAEELNTDKILNVTVAQAPNLPLEPAFPKVWLNIAIGALLAGIFGFAAIYLEEEYDPKVYSTDTISRASGLQAVAILPDAR